MMTPTDIAVIQLDEMVSDLSIDLCLIPDITRRLAERHGVTVDELILGYGELMKHKESQRERRAGA